MYKFTFILTEDDFLAANQHHYLHSPGNQKRMKIMRCGTPVAVILIVAAMSCFYKIGNPILNLLIVVAISLVFFICFEPIIKMVSRLIIGLSMESMKREGKLPFHKNITLLFGEDAIEELYDTGSATTKYEAVERIEMDENTIYFYISAVQILVLPLSVFADDEKKEGFLSFLRAKIPAGIRYYVTHEAQASVRPPIW